MIDGAKSLEGVTVFQMVSSFGRESCGAGYAISNLSAALWRANVNVFLVSVDDKNDAYEVCEEAGFPRENLVRGSLIGGPRLRFSPFLVHRLMKMRPKNKAIVHQHGVWTYMAYVAGVIKSRFKCPMVLTPHGELEPYALTISPRKKALVSLLYARRNLKNASCLWALSEQEKTSICDYGYTGRVAVIPNGVSHGPLCTKEENEEFRVRHGIAPNQRIILFLSRIAPKKNLPLLLRTFARVVKLRPEWVLLIAGSDEKGHINEIRALIDDLGIQKSAVLIGPVYGKEKVCAFSSASIFTLPSHSEGLPIAVLEAMEYEKPILVTNGWTLPVKSNVKYGWRVSVEESEFENALLDATSTPDNRLTEMGRNAHAIVREQLNWDNIAQQACSLYASVLADHPRNFL